MIYTGAEIIARARYVLMDTGAKSWTAAELESWLNDGRSKLFEARPDLFETGADFICVAGARQTLPNGSKRLFAVEYNVSHKSKRQITLTSDEILARFRPTWRTLKQSSDIEHYVYDEADGAEFEVYPPAIAGTQIRISYANPPVKLTDMATSLATEGELGAAYIDYVLARAFMKESDTSPVAMDRANMHMSAFMAAVAGEAQTKIGLSPNAQRDGGEPPNTGQ